LQELQEVRRLLDKKPYDVELQQREQALSFELLTLGAAMGARLIKP
jgi:hypothetical protein